MKLAPLRHLAVICALVSAASAPATASDSLDGIVRAEILPGWTTAQGTQFAGIRLVLAEGWKTYWRAPGDLGIPPRLEWAGSENLRDVVIHWPRPQVFDTDGTRTIGYKHEVVLPIELTPSDRTAPIMLNGLISIGVCRDVCVPVDLALMARLPAPSQDRPIRAALAQQPDPASRAGVSAVRCSVEPIADGLRLTATITIPRLSAPEIAVIELADANVWVSEATTTRKGGQVIAVSDLVPTDTAPFFLDRSTVRITLLAGAQAVDIQGCSGG